MTTLCPDCGAYMEFDEINYIWFCPYCGYEDYSCEDDYIL